MANSNVKYHRVLSPQAVAYLRGEGGPLLTIIREPGVRAAGSEPRLPIDVQLRRGDEIAFYAGMAKILAFVLTSGVPRIAVDDDYRPHEMTDGDPRSIAERWPEHRDNVKIKDRYRGKEGYWQSVLAVRYGPGYREGDPWCVVDAQTMIEFPSRSNKREELGAIEAPYQQLAEALFAKSNPGFRLPQGLPTKSLGDRLDLVAVTPDGDIAVVEIKDGANSQGIYLSPLQTGFYVELLERFKSELAAGLQALVRQKKELGLLPPSAPMPKDATNARVFPCVVVGNPKWRSSCWSTLKAVLEQCRLAKPAVFEGLQLMAYEMDGDQTTIVREIPDKILELGLPWF